MKPRAVVTRDVAVICVAVLGVSGRDGAGERSSGGGWDSVLDSAGQGSAPQSGPNCLWLRPGCLAQMIIRQEMARYNQPQVWVLILALLTDHQ